MSAFYIPVYGGQSNRPTTYKRTDTPGKTARFEHYDALDTNFVVHSKMYLHEKPRAYVVRGIRDDRLLVQTVIGTEHDPEDRWHRVDVGDTVEGRRFKRYAFKPIMTIIQLGLKAKAIQARAAKNRVSEEDRAERVGTCPCCFGDFVVQRQAMVHHGYHRPGTGAIEGDCHGVKFPPFEISCEGTKSLLTVLRAQLAMRTSALANLDRIDQISDFSDPSRVRMWRRGEDGFPRAVENRRGQLTYEIRSLTRDIATLEGRVETWAPSSWPRVRSPHDGHRGGKDVLRKGET